MAATAAIISAVTATASLGASIAQSQATNKAQRDAASIERARAQIQNNREARRAIAARRIQESEIIAASQTQGTRTSSGVSGAVGSLRSDTASNIGAANTDLAASTAQSRILQSGATKATNLGAVAQTFQSASSLSRTVAQSPDLQNKIKKFFT